jgi:peroxiredoxin
LIHSGEAPDFELPALDGGREKLQDHLAAGPVLLVFFKTTCPTCQLTLPYLERLEQGRPADAPHVIAISQDDAATTREFRKRYGLSLATLLDPFSGVSTPYAVSNAYGLTHVPSLFLIAPDRRIVSAVAGFDRAELEKLAAGFGMRLFNPSDRVPVYQPG